LQTHWYPKSGSERRARTAAPKHEREIVGLKVRGDHAAVGSDELTTTLAAGRQRGREQRLARAVLDICTPAKRVSRNASLERSRDDLRVPYVKARAVMLDDQQQM